MSFFQLRPVVWSTALALCLQPAARSQPAAFEVASLKAVAGSAEHRSRTISGETLTVRNESLFNLIVWAYGMAAFQVGGPDWIHHVKFDIWAKAAGAVPEADLKIMMQTLLAERVHLVIHREMRPTAVLAMTVGKDGPRLKLSETQAAQILRADRGFGVMKNITMAGFAAVLNGTGPPWVVDQTGLAGVYDITLDTRHFLDQGAAPSTHIMGEAMRQAAEKQLGLHFAAAKTPVEYLVVVRADKAPVEN